MRSLDIKRNYSKLPVQQYLLLHLFVRLFTSTKQSYRSKSDTKGFFLFCFICYWHKRASVRWCHREQSGLTSPKTVYLQHRCTIYTVKGKKSNSRESQGSSLTLALVFLPKLTHAHTVGRSQVQEGKSNHKILSTWAGRITNVCSTIIQRREDLCSSLK